MRQRVGVSAGSGLGLATPKYRRNSQQTLGRHGHVPPAVDANPIGGQDLMCRVIATLGQGGGARAARAPPQAFQSNSATETRQWPQTPFRFAFRAFRPPLGLSGFDGRPRHGAVLRDFQRNSVHVGTRNLATTRFRFRDALDSRELLPHAQSGHLAEPIRAPQPPDCPPKCGTRGA